MGFAHPLYAGSIAIGLSVSAAVAQDVKIGMTGTFTGPNAAIGQNARAALRSPTMVMSSSRERS